MIIFEPRCVRKLEKSRVSMGARGMIVSFRSGIEVRRMARQHGVEVPRVDVGVHQDHALGQGKLALAEQGQTRLHRLAPVAHLHAGDQQVVEARLVVSPQPGQLRTQQLHQRPHHLLGGVADVLVLLGRLADHRRREDRRPAPGDPPDVEHREWRGERVVAEVIAEGALHPPLVRRDHPLQHELRRRRHAMESV